MSLDRIQDNISLFLKSSLPKFPRVQLPKLQSSKISRYVDILQAQMYSTKNDSCISKDLEEMIPNKSKSHPVIIKGDQLWFFRRTQACFVINIFDAYTFEFTKTRVIPFKNFEDKLTRCYYIVEVFETSTNTVWIVFSVERTSHMFVEIDIKHFQIIQIDTSNSSKYIYEESLEYMRGILDRQQFFNTPNTFDCKRYTPSPFVNFFQQHGFTEDVKARFECLVAKEKIGSSTEVGRHCFVNGIESALVFNFDVQESRLLMQRKDEMKVIQLPSISSVAFFILNRNDGAVLLLKFINPEFFIVS